MLMIQAAALKTPKWFKYQNGDVKVSKYAMKRLLTVYGEIIVGPRFWRFWPHKLDNPSHYTRFNDDLTIHGQWYRYNTEYKHE